VHVRPNSLITIGSLDVQWDILSLPCLMVTLWFNSRVCVLYISCVLLLQQHQKSVVHTLLSMLLSKILLQMSVKVFLHQLLCKWHGLLLSPGVYDNACTPVDILAFCGSLSPRNDTLPSCRWRKWPPDVEGSCECT
jgi:hypothetical protein